MQSVIAESNRLAKILASVRAKWGEPTEASKPLSAPHATIQSAGSVVDLSSPFVASRPDVSTSVCGHETGWFLS